MTMHRITANYSPGERRVEVHDGADHLVVPVVMIVEGVLNGALVPSSEFGRYVEAWNGIPVPVLHPEQDGQPISANRPDVVERNTVGRVYNAAVEDEKLKAELWLNIEKASALGYSQLVDALRAGRVIEVSTGYFSDDDYTPGVYNGRDYTVVHRNIRPDHLALLPGQVGACSIEDGCGTRVNSKRSSLAMKVNEAWAVISKSLGLNTNCECKGNESMDILKKAQDLVKANMLDAKQLAAIQKMAPADRELMAAFIGALGGTEAEEPSAEAMEEVIEETPEDMAEEEKPAGMAANKKAAASFTKAQIDKLVANGVKEHLRRHTVVAQLTANTANKLTAKQMDSMSVDQLEAVEQMIRPADYSGAGGFATNSSAADIATVTPLRPRGVLVNTKKDK